MGNFTSTLRYGMLSNVINGMPGYSGASLWWNKKLVKFNAKTLCHIITKLGI